MNVEINTLDKPVSTVSWYDFAGQLTDLIPQMHPGGEEGTRELLEMCKIGSGSRVLDIGCGAGATACLIGREFGSRVEGIDISEVMIARANRRAEREGLANSLEFRICDVRNIPFEGDSFDVIIVESVLTPLPGDKNAAMLEMVRVLKPKGIVGINECIVYPDCPNELLAVLKQHPAFQGYFTPETLLELVLNSGLELVELRQVDTQTIPEPRLDTGNLLAFLFKVYPKLLIRLIRDRDIRTARALDEKLTRMGKGYMGYALVVAKKPG